jgi:signal transduction histidine kinase
LSKVEGEVQRTDEVIEHWSERSQAARVSELKRVPVTECLRLALDCARLPPAVGLELAPPNELLEVEADRDALAFAVRCLIENAGEAMGAGVVCVSAERAADSCRMTVTDSGPGIADPARCLERFESSKPGHLGLGLCMARRIVTRLGGDLVVGAPEAGAEVSLFVPLAGTRATEAPA